MVFVGLTDHVNQGLVDRRVDVQEEIVLVVHSHFRILP